MTSWRNISIKNKLLTIILLISSLSLGLGFAAIIFQDIITIKSDMVNAVILDAKLIGEYCVVPLAFEDKESATEILNKIQTIPYIKSGYIYDSNGNLFASFKPDKSEFLIENYKLNEDTESEFIADILFISQPIVFNDYDYGTIKLLASTNILEEKVRDRLAALILLIVALIIFSYLLALKLQAIILKPILDLADVTQRISSEGDYSVRVNRMSADEIGILYESFNNMLEQIHIRERERDKAEDEKTRLNGIIENTSDLVSMARFDSSLIYMNRAGRNMLGWSSDEDIRNKNISDIHPDWAFQIINKEGIPAANENGVWEGETALMGPDGKEIAVLQVIMSHKSPDGEFRYLSTIMRDISERKQAEEKLQKSEEKYRSVFESFVDLYYQTDINGIITNISPSCYKMSGYTPDELIGKPVKNVYADPGEREILMELLLSEGYVNDHEIQLLNKDGKSIPTSINSRVIYDKFNKPIGVEGTIRNISDRKKAEAALWESERKFRNISEGILDGVAVTIDGKNHWVNKAFAKIFGYSSEELIGKGFDFIIAPEEVPVINERMKRRLTGMPVPSRYETRAIRKDGTTITIEISAKKIMFEENQAIQIIVRDTTETKRLQDFASRAQRLETAGRIAGQVAHDFNNLLGPILAYPEFIKENTTLDSSSVKFLDAIEKSAETMAEINQQLLTLSRRGHYTLEAINLNKIINEIIEQIDNIKPSVHIKTELNINLLAVQGGKSQISRVISNMIINALDAMNNNGILTIKTDNYYIETDKIKYGRIPKGEYAKVSISDTGAGIPDDIMPKIFDPFFTTKSAEKSRGSGLGLSIVHSVMEDHDGYIDLKSTIGTGTTFYLYFPVTRDSKKPLSIDNIVGGNEKILIVDDDKTQREVSQHLLSKLGYRTATVENGEKAIEFIKNNPQDLLILDMIMPGHIDGAETYRQALEVNPDQKAIIVSGYAETERIQYANKLGAKSFIKKPLTIKTVAVAVRKELDQI
ncbi:MAG: PAS domain S-box protein [candidate division Zixibacteria bacterium]|nr:PAS domain S-box protein [candidate division Zixibacteria bacterium]